MAIRTTSALVAGVLVDSSASANGQGDYDGTTDLTPYILIASRITDRVATCASNKGITLDTEELEVIERWLAAHYYQSSDQALASKSTGGASGSFQGQTGKRLEGTKYGQAALDLDYSGCLNAIQMRAFAGAKWLGKVPSDQVRYSERD